jgi:hypothetical protein
MNPAADSGRHKRTRNDVRGNMVYFVDLRPSG